MLIFFLLIFTSPAVEKHLTAYHPEWVVQSRQLIGESEEKRNQALDILKKRFTTAEDILKEAEGDYRPYALDVLVALNLPHTVDQLLPRLEKDPDGAFTLAVNALLNSDNHLRIAQRYSDLLTGGLDRLSTPQIVAMVDFFTHLKKPCADAVCEALLNHKRLEVQQAAALNLDVTPKTGKVDLLKKHIGPLFPQVRAQVMLTLYREDKSSAEEVCKGDNDPIVKSACDGVDFKPPEIKKPTKKEDKKSDKTKGKEKSAKKADKTAKKLKEKKKK